MVASALASLGTAAKETANIAKEAAKETANIAKEAAKETANIAKEAAKESAKEVAAPLNAAVDLLKSCKCALLIQR
jgi:replicative DNA helicase